MDEKRELVYALSEWSHGAPEMLQSWSRHEILEILCAEMGKERKYTGLTKLKIIEHLLKIVSEKKLLEHSGTTTTTTTTTTVDVEVKASPEFVHRAQKRQRKIDNPNCFPFASNVVLNNNVVVENTICCKNSACRAKLSCDAAFCKRCSCCICHKYDDNKDPSLWLICNSEIPFPGESCGMSCHLECAFRHERSGIGKEKQDERLDGSFNCVFCGKVNDIFRCWRKQLLVARETRRVDILCYRLSLSQKILGETKYYANLKDIVDEAVKKLEDDIGPLTGLPMKMARGIVNRLSSGPEVQRLCALAIDSLDNMPSARASEMLSVHNATAVKSITVEDVCESSVTVTLGFEDSSQGNVVGYTLWHRKADDLNYPAEPTCTLFAPSTKFLLSGLIPDTDYLIKVVSLDSNRDLGMREIHFQTASSEMIQEINPNSKIIEVERSESPVTNCSSLSNPSSVEDETNHVVPCSNNTPEKNSGKVERVIINGETMSLLDEERHSMGRMILSRPPADNVKNSILDADARITEDTSKEEAALPITPLKVDKKNKGLIKNTQPIGKLDITNENRKVDDPQGGSTSKKRSGGGADRGDEESVMVDKDFEYYVKVIRWLECDGHIETEFRQKFLTWYSLRATAKEVRIVKVFVDTFIEDPESLSGQLMDTFSDIISNKRSSSSTTTTLVPAGFCMKLWH